jgi:hypothetical protein
VAADEVEISCGVDMFVEGGVLLLSVMGVWHGDEVVPAGVFVEEWLDPKNIPDESSSDGVDDDSGLKEPKYMFGPCIDDL